MRPETRLHPLRIQQRHRRCGQGRGEGDGSRAKRGTCALIVASILLCLGSQANAQSVARQWNEALLDAVRVDFARPTVHARNLWHTSVAMWDSWAAYDSVAINYLHIEKIAAGNVAAARAETMSYACYRILTSRFADSPGAAQSLPAFDALMSALSYDINNTSTVGNTPAALGNRIAATVLAFGDADGSNEANSYENQYYNPVNPPLVPALPGNPDIVNPNRWQPLALDFFIDQGGNVILGGFPEFLSPEWGHVSAFALSPVDRTVYTRNGFDYWVFHDPGEPPYIGTASDEDYKWGFELVALWSAHLDANDGVMIDISPASIGNSLLPDPGDYRTFYNDVFGGDWGKGYSINPVTLQLYQPQIVPRGDYARVLAEFWADGPESETPPGHWFVIANYVSDHPQTVKRIAGRGQLVGDLEWDVKLYFALGGAMHDSAVAAWGIKGWYDYVRPISALRYMADRGQSSDPNGPSYDPNGVRLHPGLIEVVTAATTAGGERHEHLAGEEGKIALYAWRGPAYIGDPDVDVAGVSWILAENWWPYQRPTFVTPPFAGYVSGHSTYSRAGAVILTMMTGSKFFPGGLGEFFCPQNSFLVFEEGPSVDITLQWATYNDASDQTSLSRIWGGIHPPADDIPGRYIGQAVGEDAFALAMTYFDESGAAPAGLCGDLNLDQEVDADDIALNRLALADPVGQALSTDAIARCGVVDVPGECGIRQVVVMRRALADPPQGPGIQLACEAAAGNAVTVTTEPDGVAATIGAQGGVLVTEGSDGTRYTLPPNAHVPDHRATVPQRVQML